MLNLAQAFAERALVISQIYGGPYYDAILHAQGQPVYDVGGSIVTPGTSTSRPCQAQVDMATQDMRQAEGYTEADMRIMILTDTLAGSPTLDETIEILAGPHKGEWRIQSIMRDSMNIYWELRGRQA
jgi:hypothetical protein